MSYIDIHSISLHYSSKLSSRIDQIPIVIFDKIVVNQLSQAIVFS